MAASARVEKGSCQLNRHRAYIGLLRGRVFPGRFSGQISIPELGQAQRLAGFHAQELVGFPAQGLVGFVLIGQGQSMFLWFWFQDQSVFLSLVLF